MERADIIEILGTGNSISEYKKNKNTTIGVNDVFKIVPVDYLIIIDKPDKFTAERIETIKKSKPLLLFTHLNHWNEIMKCKIEHIKLAKGRGALKELDTPAFCYSNNSTFVAVILAYKFGAKKIILHGVDFKNHHTLGRTQQLQRAMKDFKNLFLELKKRNVHLFVSSAESALSEFIPILK